MLIATIIIREYLYRAQFFSIGFHVEGKVSCCFISKTHLYMCDQGFAIETLILKTELCISIL